MHCDICCSFPLHDMLKFHLKKEAKMLTIMSVKLENLGPGTYGKFIYVEESKGKIYYKFNL